VLFRRGTMQKPRIPGKRQAPFLRFANGAESGHRTATAPRSHPRV